VDAAIEGVDFKVGSFTVLGERLPAQHLNEANSVLSQLWHMTPVTAARFQELEYEMRGADGWRNSLGERVFFPIR
jgi:hypothetical protein